MPSLKRGFLFKYFDKFICGLVALGLLVGVVYTLGRASALPEKIQPQNVNPFVDTIKDKLNGPAHALTASVPKALNVLAKAPAVRPNIFIWPLPVEYPPIKVGLNKEFVLQFKAPLGEGSVTVQAREPIIDIVEHPVDGDYSKVKVRSRGFEGQAAVVGYEGLIAHIYPVIVDSSVNKTAYAPTLKVAGQQGAVTLNIVEDPKIADEGVVVTYYEIWRRDWSDPLGKYELVDEVDQSGNSLSGSGTGRSAAPRPAAAVSAPVTPPTLMPGFSPYGMPVPGGGRMPMTIPAGRGTARGTGAQPVEAGIAWTDANATPGDQYSYKARVIGNNTFPTEGEFCDPVKVEVLPDIDFRFRLTTADSVQFDVVKAAGANSATKATFWRGVGDAIGDIVNNRTTGEQVNYSTGYVLVDIQPTATQSNKPGPAASDLRGRPGQPARPVERRDKGRRPVGPPGGGNHHAGHGRPAVHAALWTCSPSRHALSRRDGTYRAAASGRMGRRRPLATDFC